MRALRSAEQYEMTGEEERNVQRFLEELKGAVLPERYPVFETLIKHLCVVQDPYNKEYPHIDNVIHGIEVARLCMMKRPELSEVLLLGAIGHDWDRACGERRIKSADYPNTEEGYRQYKEKHARNSADLFCAELRGGFDDELIAGVYDMILNHEIGGEGEAGVLDFADGMNFFTHSATDYFRHRRMYAGENGNGLSPEQLEEERKKGFATKVIFMTDTMSAEELDFLRAYVQKNRDRLTSVVREELADLLGCDISMSD